MIRYSMTTRQQNIIREPDETQVSRERYAEWKTGFLDGVPLDPDDWSIIEYDTRDIVALIEKDKLTP